MGMSGAWGLCCLSKQVGMLKGSEDSVNSLTFTPNGNSLAKVGRCSHCGHDSQLMPTMNDLEHNGCYALLHKPIHAGTSTCAIHVSSEWLVEMGAAADTNCTWLRSRMQNQIKVNIRLWRQHCTQWWPSWAIQLSWSSHQWYHVPQWPQATHWSIIAHWIESFWTDTLRCYQWMACIFMTLMAGSSEKTIITWCTCDMSPGHMTYIWHSMTPPHLHPM